MSDWLNSIPNLGVPGVPGVLPQKTATFDSTPGVPEGVPGVPERRAGTPDNRRKCLIKHGEPGASTEHRYSGNPAATLRDWHRYLAALDFNTAPAGFALNWWRQTCDDAHWIYEHFASRAVRVGWSAHDLFGILPWHPGWGGLCDRIRGARNLKMEVDGRKAAWSNWGVTDWTCAGAGDQLITSRLVLIWEMENTGATGA